MKCCICGKEFHGWGNNPTGAISEDLHIRKFKPTDVCCDECNKNSVIVGRLASSKARGILQDLRSQNSEVSETMINEAYEAGKITKSIKDFILTNIEELK